MSTWNCTLTVIQIHSKLTHKESTQLVPYQIRSKIFVATTHALKPPKVVSARATLEGTGVIAKSIFTDLEVRISLWKLAREKQTKQRVPPYTFMKTGKTF